MILYPQIAGKNLYSIRLWHCSDYQNDWHSNTEILICIKGQCDAYVEGVSYRLKKDDVLFVSSCEAHEFFCSNSETKVIIISYGYSLLGYDYRRLQNISFGVRMFNMNDNSVSPKIIEPLARIKERLLNPKEDSLISRWENRSDLYAISVYLLETKLSKPVPKERQARIKQLENNYGVLNYISEHYHESISVNQAAAIAGYDKSYFCRQFRKITGMTFHRYLNCYRITIACQLLLESDAPVSVVAERSGFASGKMMSRLFRDILGVTPTQYRKLSPEKRNSILPL